MPTVSMKVNGKEVSGDVEGRTLLVEFIRDKLGLTGTHVGCDTSQCGACTVHLDGVATRSCQVTVADAAGARITTIEGLGGKAGAATQTAWRQLDVVQCGYCQSGQIMAAAALLTDNPKPSDADIDAAMSGNLCRCATYQRIRAAVHRAAELMEA